MNDVTMRADSAGIAAFAADVRAELNDLPVDEVDELVDGLEADLSDQAADAGEGFALPNPADYAAELRAAAGLEPRAARRRFGGAALFERVRSGARSEWERAMRVPLVARSTGFLASLRPVWWLLRAWALYAIVASWLGLNDRIVGLPRNAVGWMLLLTLIVLSVQWGRGRWDSRRWVRAVWRGATAVAVVALPVAAMAFYYSLQQPVYPDVPYSAYSPGLVEDGARVRNIFAYDAQGNPLENVQLFDQDGAPLATVGESGGGDGMDPYVGCGGAPLTVPMLIPGRGELWNVYPLREIAADYGCVDPAQSQAIADAPQRPYDSVAPLGGATADPPQGADAGPTPGASPAPSVSPDPEASAPANPQPSTAPAPTAGAGG